MRRFAGSSRWARWGVATLVALATPRLAVAVCSFGPNFGQLSPSCGGGYCYVVSPGLGTSQSLVGTFWSLGTGKPAIGPGDDSGGWPVAGWLLPEGSRLFLGGDWQESPAIDGCIAGRIAPGKPAEIMIASISDESGGVGFFAVASARRFMGAFPEFDFTFLAGGGQAHDIDLVEIPRSRIVSGGRPDVYQFRGPTLSDVSPGIYGDGSLMPDEVVKGYRVYERSQHPTSQKTSAGWSAITGLVPLGQDVSVSVPCPAGGELYLAYALAFDSEFETAHVGRYSHVVCDPCPFGDKDGDGYLDAYGNPECCPIPEVCTDCNGLDPRVHLGALELCNGIDDDCNFVVDDVALPGSVGSLQLGKDPGATRLEWSPLAVATRYDVVRGNLTTLLAARGSYAEATQVCLANAVTASHADDPEDPGRDDGFWYVLRAGNCTGAGSYDDADPSQAASRDAGIAASGHACP